MKLWLDRRSILIALVSLLCFGNTLFNDYNLDDELVTKDHPLTSPSNNQSLAKLFQSNYEQSETIQHGYRPIVLLSFYLEHKLFGESPFVSHLINLILYTLLCVLLYQLLLLIFKNIKKELLLFVILLFACLPIHTEVVASIKNRDEILSFLFLIIGLMASLSWVKKGKFLALLITMLALCLSFLSKKSSVPLVFISPIILFFYSAKTLSLKKAGGLILSYSVPFSLLIINFSWLLGVYLSIACFLLFSTLFFIRKPLRNYLTSLCFIEILGLATSLFLVLFSFFHHEQTIYLIAMVFMLVLVKKRPLEYLIFSAIVASIGFLIFYESYFIFYSIFLLSGAINASKSDKRRPKVLITALLFFIALIGTLKKGESYYFVVLLIPYLVVLSEKIHKYLPLTLSLITLIVSSLFFNVSILVIGLNLLTISLLLFNSKRKKLQAVSLSMLLVISTFSLDNAYEKNTSFFKTLSSQGSEKVESNLIGRELAYAENPLVGEHDSAQRIMAGIYTFSKYTWLMAFPLDLNYYYGYAEISLEKITLLRIFIWILLMILLFLVAWKNKRSNPLLISGLVWFGVALIPFSNFFYLVAGFVGERLAFISSFGFCVLIGGMIYQFYPRFSFSKIKLPQAVVILISISLSIKTIARNSFWKNHLSLMSHDIEDVNRSAHAHYLLAINAVKSLTTESDSIQTFKMIDLAETHLKQAINIYKDLDTYHFELGKVYLVKNELSKAENSFKNAIELEPNSTYAYQELIKVSFSLKKFENVIQYGEYYLQRDQTQQLIFELTAIAAFNMNDSELCRKYTLWGLRYFPQSENLNQILRRLPSS